MLRSQTLLWSNVSNQIDYMALKCVIDLGIPLRFPVVVEITPIPSGMSRPPYRAPLCDVGPTVFMPPLRSFSLPNSQNCHNNNDRFIPDRSSMDFDFAHFRLTESSREKENARTAASSPAKEAYRKLLAETLLNNRTRILSFKSKPPIPCDDFLHESSSNAYTSHATKSARQRRYISQTAERTLDASDLVDDYYLNLLDWGSNNFMSIALGNTVYLWNATDGSISELVTVEIIPIPA